MPAWYPQNCATTTNVQPLYYPQNSWATANYQPIYTNTSATSYAVSPNVTWQQWVNTAPTMNSYQITTDRIWNQWVVTQNDYRYTPYPVETAEQVQARQRRVEQMRERHAATARARVLLGEHLTEEQRRELEAKGSFHVTGSRGRRYCIRTHGQSGNVDLLNDHGDIQASLCAHPGGYLPDGDAWLMQMMEIRHDEDHFLAVANVHRGRLPAGLGRQPVRL